LPAQEKAIAQEFFSSPSSAKSQKPPSLFEKIGLKTRVVTLNTQQIVYEEKRKMQRISVPHKTRS